MAEATHEVHIYTMPGCGNCKMIKEMLTRKEIPFTAHDLTSDVEGQHFMDEHGFRVVPVTTVDGEIIIGGKVGEIKKALGLA